MGGVRSHRTRTVRQPGDLMPASNLKLPIILCSHGNATEQRPGAKHLGHRGVFTMYNNDGYDDGSRCMYTSSVDPSRESRQSMMKKVNSNKLY